jgi:hypothetical protein
MGATLKHKEFLPRVSSLLKISLLGGFSILASLLYYQWITANYPVEARNIQFLQATAYIVLALVLLGLVIIVAAATRYFRSQRSDNATGSLSETVVTISQALSDKRSFRAFVLSSALYGVLFGFLSSFLVYRPLESFSYSYGVNVPSTLAVLCCGPFGQMPQFVIYLTQQFAILIVPANLILLVIVSWLVGLNAGIATFAFSNRPVGPSGKWLTGFAAIVGLFTVCPSCAGFFLLTLLGLTGAVGLALTLSSLQAVFISIGLPILLVSPVLSARRVAIDRQCAIMLHPSEA